MKLTDLTPLFEDAPEVMTTGEVCGLIRASESYLYRLVAENRLPCFCVRRSLPLSQGRYSPMPEGRSFQGKHNMLISITVSAVAGEFSM